MGIQKVLGFGFAALLLAGFVTAGPNSSRLREATLAEADGLIGGEPACATYYTSSCSFNGTAGCPTNRGYDAGGGNVGVLGKPSGTVFCGCVSSCNNQSMVKGLYDQGCGSSGTTVAE